MQRFIREYHVVQFTSHTAFPPHGGLCQNTSTVRSVATLTPTGTISITILKGLTDFAEGTAPLESAILCSKPLL